MKSKFLRESSDKKDIEEIAKIVEQESALIRIGKNGLTDSILKEILHLINKKRALKIKILPNAPIQDSSSFFNELQNKTGFVCWRKKGNTGVFINKKYDKQKNLK